MKINSTVRGIDSPIVDQGSQSTIAYAVLGKMSNMSVKRNHFLGSACKREDTHNMYNLELEEIEFPIVSHYVFPYWFLKWTPNFHGRFHK